LEITMNKFQSWLAGSLTALALIAAAPASAGDAVTQAQIEAATSAAQHEAIARSYDEQAVAAESQAKSHAKMAQTYRLASSSKMPRDPMANHCSRLEKDTRDMADEYRSMAAEHRKMAAEAN
jgi:cytochrome c551/c552